MIKYSPMVTALQSLRLLVVSALALSLTVGPFCAMSAGAACPLAQADRVEDLLPGQCCCGDHCHCVNCPAAHPEQQQKKKDTPVNQTDSRDLAKINFTASYSLSAVASGASAIVTSPASLGEGIHLQSLVSLHTCLRV
jgi:hypothetical protein